MITIVTERYTDISYLEGKVDRVIEFLKSVREKYGQEARIDFEIEDHEFGGQYIELTISRPETDSERLLREQKNKEREEIAKQCRRNQYEALKKEFGE